MTPLSDGAADYDDVLLRLPDSAIGAVRPTLPLSVVAGPAPGVEATYGGGGGLGAGCRGRWHVPATLAPATARPVRVQLPLRFQGRHVNLAYHELHVLEMARLYGATGEQPALTYGLRWQPLAPSTTASSSTAPDGVVRTARRRALGPLSAR